MYYSAIGLLAAAILLIENGDILLNRTGALEKAVWKVYRRFLFAVLAYYITDILWGVLESRKLRLLLFADTTVYFAAMAVGVLFWAQFTVAYLEEENAFGRFLVYACRFLAALIALLSVGNIFVPVLFSVDAGCVYTALPVRYAMLACQILLLLLLAGYAFSSLRRGTQKEKRYLALGGFGLIMGLFLLLQLWFPLYPLYATAYLLGTCLLHSFVINDEKEEYKRAMEEAEKANDLGATVSSLLENLPAMIFTKDAETGVYLACNRAFAAYAHKESPADAIGRTDAELYAPETAKHFVQEDQVALSMDEPYVFFEEVQDADGSLRQLQTTKLKYQSHAGRLCVLGMCQDVTDMVRIQRDRATSKEDYEQAKTSSLMFNHIAQTLTHGYSVLYYVNVDTEEFIKYNIDDDGGALVEVGRGWHFFEECRVRAGTVVHPDDRAAYIKALKRKKLLAALEQNGNFVLTFRYMKGEEPIYLTLTASRMEDDAQHIIIGFSDVDEEMKRRRETVRAREEQIAYTRLSALAGEYLGVYVVDPASGAYREVSAMRNYEKVLQAKEGRDFFGTTREMAHKVIHAEDLRRFLSAFTKENILTEIERRGSYTLSYRLLMEGKPIYVQLKAAMVAEDEGERLIVGINDIDAQVRQEEEYVKHMAKARLNANIDALTGVKNRHAYLEAEERLNIQIEEQHAPDFAVVLLDVNDLKKVNDTAGHQAGDQYLRDACKIIYGVFRHSTIYRIGGDEFALIAYGNDYAHIDELLGKMQEHNLQAQRSGGIVIACGMAKYSGDDCVALVFERADQKMYENKNRLKAKKA